MSSVIENELLFSGLLVGVFAILFVTPVLMSLGIVKVSDDATGKDKFLSIIPLANIINSSKIYFGKCGLYLFATFFMILSITGRVLQWRFAYENITLGLICMALFWISILVYVIVNIRFVYCVLKDSGMTGGIVVILSLLYPLGQVYCMNALKTFYTVLHQKKDVGAV